VPQKNKVEAKVVAKVEPKVDQKKKDLSKHIENQDYQKHLLM
jgi:hypothetical protein